MLTYVRPAHSEAIVFDLDELVGQLVKVVTPDFAASGVAVEKVTATPSATMVGDAEHLRQALLNLLMNSREAMPDGGNIRIVLAAWDNPEARTPGLEIAVEDTGVGFATESLGHAFDAFVSGKRLGTGLGLANVRRFVKEHRGEIEAVNRVECGARVSIRLPRGLEALDKPAQTVTKTKETMGHE